ncbi:MAG: MBL fold metallo-hydrolase [Acidobacteriota bacterium]
MKVINLTENSSVYTCNAYLILGTWNTLDDVNCLVDVGRDEAIIQAIYEASTGVGKKRIEQVVITHNHYDHAGMLSAIRKEFNPTVMAFTKNLHGVNQVLHDGQKVMMGDREFEVIHVTAHSNDSICLLSFEEKVLFSGDTPLKIMTPDISYEPNYINFLKRLINIGVKTVYPGHGPAITSGCRDMLKKSLENASKHH